MQLLSFGIVEVVSMVQVKGYFDGSGIGTDRSARKWNGSVLMNFELLGKPTLRSKDDQPRQRTALHSSAYYNNNDNNWHQGEYEKGR